MHRPADHPFVAGIAGLVRSANPLLTKQNVYDILTRSADLWPNRNDFEGYGVPNARTAVDLALGLAPGRPLANRLTPLFSFYGPATEDHLYTAVPQVASSAVSGLLHGSCTSLNRQGYWARSFIETIYHEGVTNGCATNPLRYCPESQLTRAEIAPFLLRAKLGGSYQPPPAACNPPVFADVPCTHWAAAWIQQLAAQGITSGCGGTTSTARPVSSTGRAWPCSWSRHSTSEVKPRRAGEPGPPTLPHEILPQRLTQTIESIL